MTETCAMLLEIKLSICYIVAPFTVTGKLLLALLDFIRGMLIFSIEARRGIVTQTCTMFLDVPLIISDKLAPFTLTGKLLLTL